MRTLKRKTTKQHEKKLENWNHDNENLPYTKEEDNDVWHFWLGGEAISIIAEDFERSMSAIESKISHILEDYGKTKKNEKQRMGGRKHDHVKLSIKRNGKWWDHCDVIDEKLHNTMVREKRTFYHILERDGTKGAYRVAELTGRTHRAVMAKIEKTQEKRPTLFDSRDTKQIICPKCGHKF